MNFSRYATGIVGVVSLTAIPFACSSLPDVRFDEGDGASGGDARAETSAADATNEAATNDAATGCNGLPEGGACCGTKICRGCGAKECTECEALAACLGSVDQACCVRAKGKDPVTCTAFSSCN